ncbi:hypothetical protein TNCT_315441 [Trichonephila clavata]|uniref:Uncharacterized protein n=1 Tax=Trichonephila clavata TaxID=2740835 RepID=A0A8X6F4K1_TRICU|nr:hypothetical protein TNCT_315441 [Trichonephila clavata]
MQQSNLQVSWNYEQRASCPRTNIIGHDRWRSWQTFRHLCGWPTPRDSLRISQLSEHRKLLFRSISGSGHLIREFPTTPFILIRVCTRAGDSVSRRFRLRTFWEREEGGRERKCR